MSGDCLGEALQRDDFCATIHSFLCAARRNRATSSRMKIQAPRTPRCQERQEEIGNPGGFEQVVSPPFLALLASWRSWRVSFPDCGLAHKSPLLPIRLIHLLLLLLLVLLPRRLRLRRLLWWRFLLYV